MSVEVKVSRKWLARIVARVDRAFARLPEPYWLKGEWPIWVQSVGRELSKTYFPTAKLRFSPKWEPGEIGAMLGQHIAYLDSLGDERQLPKTKISWKKLRLVYGEDIRQRAEAYEKKFRRRFLPELERAFKFSVNLALEQDYPACSKFFAAFGRAVERRPSGAADIGRTNTKIYILLLIAWRSVEKLGSIPRLHEVLCKIFGTHVVGSIKRIEKMCERLGLSYREIAARNESRNSDKNSLGMSGDGAVVIGDDSNRGNNGSSEKRQAKIGVDQKRSSRSSKH